MPCRGRELSPAPDKKHPAEARREGHPGAGLVPAHAGAGLYVRGAPPGPYTGSRSSPGRGMCTSSPQLRRPSNHYFTAAVLPGRLSLALARPQPQNSPLLPPSTTRTADERNIPHEQRDGDLLRGAAIKVITPLLWDDVRVSFSDRIITKSVIELASDRSEVVQLAIKRSNGDNALFTWTKNSVFYY